MMDLVWFDLICRVVCRDWPAWLSVPIQNTHGETTRSQSAGCFPGLYSQTVIKDRFCCDRLCSCCASLTTTVHILGQSKYKQAKTQLASNSSYLCLCLCTPSVFDMHAMSLLPEPPLGPLHSFLCFFFIHSLPTSFNF